MYPWCFDFWYRLHYLCVGYPRQKIRQKQFDKERDGMKRFISLILSLTFVLVLAGCNNRSMNYIIENEPSVVGVVEEVHDDYVIMYSETAEGYPNGSRWSISLTVESKDSYADPVVGDEIVVYYDGNVMETDPLKVGTVYAITLKTPANRK